MLGFDLPLWQGEEACLHLMSVISPLADDLALVHAPLLPAAFYQLLRGTGHPAGRGDPEEFEASFGLSLNVLPTAPREVIAVAGFPKTQAAMEAAGCRVADLRGRRAVHRLRGRADLPDAPGAARMTTVGEALITLLERHGVDTVFGIPGVHTVELYRGLARRRSATSRRATSRAQASWPTAMRAPAAGRASPSSSPGRA